MAYGRFERGAIRRRHADSKTGSPNTSARMHAFGCSATGGGRTKVAGRAGKTSPELAKTLKDAAAKHGELEQPANRTIVRMCFARPTRMSDVWGGGMAMRRRAGSGTGTRRSSARTGLLRRCQTCNNRPRAARKLRAHGARQSRRCQDSQGGAPYGAAQIRCLPHSLIAPPPECV